MRDHQRELGVRLPKPRTHTQAQHALITSFADDGTLYSGEEGKLVRALALITSEFCVASGAKLNERKTRILSTVRDTTLIQSHLQEQYLKGNEWIKSLGGIYSENVRATDRYDTVIHKIRLRMTRLQHRKPSLAARVLYSNTLLSSCLWYFAYFIPPTPPQVKQFDALVKGMLWSKSPGETKAPVIINMARMSARKDAGGQGVLMPSDMLPSIQADMVNRALRGRGKWWCLFLDIFLEQAMPSYKGVDALLSTSTQVFLQRHSAFWAAAVRSWQFHHWAASPIWRRHRESVGAIPVFGTDSILTQSLGHIISEYTPAVTLLQSLGMVYATDYWDYNTLKPAEVDDTLFRLRSHMTSHNVLISQMRPVLTRILSLFQHYLYNAVYLPLRLCATTVGDSPRVQEYWGERSGKYAGKVYRVVSRARDIPEDFCTCTHGNIIHLHLFESNGGCGDTNTLLPHGRRKVCSCKLSKLITNNTHTWAYGMESVTVLDIPHLYSGMDLSVLSPVREIRLDRHARRHTTLTPQPAAAIAWVHELATPFTPQWPGLWQALSRAQISGQARTVMYKLMHMRLPLRTSTHIALWYNTTRDCTLCEETPETHSHLFYECVCVSAVWRCAYRLIRRLGLPEFADESASTALLGFLPPRPVVPPLQWNTTDPPSKPALARWAAMTWAEVRGMAIHAIWSARNCILHENALPDDATLSSYTKHAFWRQARHVLVGKRWPHLEDQQRSKDRSIYFKYIWRNATPLVNSSLKLKAVFQRT